LGELFYPDFKESHLTKIGGGLVRQNFIGTMVRTLTTVILVDSSGPVRERVSDWIHTSGTARCLAAATSKEALLWIARFRPGLVLLDDEVADESAIACASRIKQRFPEVEIIFLSARKDSDFVFQAFKAGALGYLLKPLTRETILRAIAEVDSGGAPMSPEIARRVVNTFHRPAAPVRSVSKVSRRENDVLELLSKGMSNKQIASELGISYETVCVHLRRIYEKFNVRSRTEAVIRHLQSQDEPMEYATRGLSGEPVEKESLVRTRNAELETCVAVVAP
jgi:DNA-binding NarL/FixJ family response regulator